MAFSWDGNWSKSRADFINDTGSRVTSITPSVGGLAPAFKPSLLSHWAVSTLVSLHPLNAQNSALTPGLRLSVCTELTSYRKLCGLPPHISQVCAKKSLRHGLPCPSILPYCSCPCPSQSPWRHLTLLVYFVVSIIVCSTGMWVLWGWDLVCLLW